MEFDSKLLYGPVNEPVKDRAAFRKLLNRFIIKYWQFGCYASQQLKWQYRTRFSRLAG